MVNRRLAATGEGGGAALELSSRLRSSTGRGRRLRCLFRSNCSISVSFASSNLFFWFDLVAYKKFLRLLLSSALFGPTSRSSFESDEEISALFSSINLTVPVLQQSILRPFHDVCQSPSAANIKITAVQVLIQLCELDNQNVRANVVKLLCCLTEDGDEANIVDHVSQKSIETLFRIVKTSNDEEEIVSAMSIISNLPESPQTTEWLFGAGVFI